jgi:cobalt-zinc-cadmium efflux system membrane fusion protein
MSFCAERRVATVMSFTGCSRKNGDEPSASSVKAGNVTLTAAQRQNIQIYTVEPAKFHRTIEATGVVDFDNDQATSVMAPISGPVSRLLVSLGDEVKKGDPLA